MAAKNEQDEEARLAALRRYAILDTPPEEAFDRVARLAASLFDAEIALISFVDADRQWFKSHMGLDISEAPRSGGLCAQTILASPVTFVADARKDLRFTDSPMVVSGPRLRFYAGAPLVSRDGHRLGALWVLDPSPRREFGAEDRNRLATLAGLVMNELELRLELSRRAAIERDLNLANELMSAIAEAPGVRRAMEAALKIICDAVGASSARAWSLGVRGASCQLVAAHGPGDRSIRRKSIVAARRRSLSRTAGSVKSSPPARGASSTTSPRSTPSAIRWRRKPSGADINAGSSSPSSRTVGFSRST